MTTWLARRYAQHGDTYVQLCAWLGLASVVLLLSPISTAVTGRYMGLSFDQWALSIATSDPLTLPSAAIGLFLSRKNWRIVRSWAAGRRDGLAPEDVARAAQRLPLELFFWTGNIGFATALPVGVITTLSQIDRLTFANFVLLLVGGILFSLWGLVLVWLWGDVAMRPVLAEVAPLIDTSSGRPIGPTIGLTVKLSVGLGSAFLVGSCYGGALSAPHGTAFDGLWKLTEVTLLVSVGFGLVLVPLFSATLLAPVRELTRATHRVASGDLDAQVSVTTNDELGQLSASFNGMVAGLRERTELRAANESLVQELQASRGRIVAAADAGRRRVERDLHDGAQQTLVVARVRARMLRDHVEDDTAAEQLDELQELIEHALRELRNLARGVYPAQLDDGGLPTALRDAVDRSELGCTLRLSDVGRYAPDLESAVYFACLEALQNVAKHAPGASDVLVDVSVEDGRLSFVIADDGPGFDPAAARDGTGLQNIVDRIGAIGGVVTIASSPGRGTRITGSVPVHSGHPTDVSQVQGS